MSIAPPALGRLRDLLRKGRRSSARQKWELPSSRGCSRGCEGARSSPSGMRQAALSRLGRGAGPPGADLLFGSGSEDSRWVRCFRADRIIRSSRSAKPPSFPKTLCMYPPPPKETPGQGGEKATIVPGLARESPSTTTIGHLLSPKDYRDHPSR